MNERNGIIDFWKFIAAIGVILVHIPFMGVFGNICTSIGVCGVGFFFLISGYACYGESNAMTGKIWRRFKRNGIITVLSVLVYLIFAYIVDRIEDREQVLLSMLKEPKTYFRMIFLGDFDFIHGAALWFMVALVLCYPVFILITKLRLRKSVLFILVPLLILRIAVETYICSFDPDHWHWRCNALVDGLPMMLLGYVIAMYKDKLKIHNLILIFAAILSAAAMFVTVNVKVAGLDISQPFKILCAAFLFVYAINNPKRNIFRPFELLGREDSLYIYLIHYMIIVLVTHFPIAFLDPEVTPTPMVVIILSIIIARIMSVIKKVIKSNMSPGRRSELKK